MENQMETSVDPGPWLAGMKEWIGNYCSTGDYTTPDANKSKFGGSLGLMV